MLPKLGVPFIHYRDNGKENGNYYLEFRGLKTRGTLLVAPRIRTLAFLGPYWVPPVLGNYHVQTTPKGAPNKCHPVG